MRNLIFAVAFFVGMSGTGISHATHTGVPEYIKIAGSNANFMYIKKTNIIEVKVYFNNGWKVDIFTAETLWKDDGLTPKTTAILPVVTKSFAGTDNNAIPAALTSWLDSIIPGSQVSTAH